MELYRSKSYFIRGYLSENFETSFYTVWNDRVTLQLSNMKQEYLKTNQALWDAKTPVHLKSEMYDMEAFLAGKNTLDKIELEGVGDVKGKSILHLQCHFGQDSLSWQRLGAQVTGVDFSGKAIEKAQEINKELELSAEFVQSDIYALPENLKGKFDIVFTSYGTITWLPDLDKWAKVIRHFLKPGGFFYIAEFHPSWYAFDFDTKLPAYNYFNSGEPYIETEEGTYADNNAQINKKEYFWTHSLAETSMALLNAGLVLEEFKEFDYSPWNCFPNLTQRAEREFVFDAYGVSIPHVYSLKMRG